MSETEDGNLNSSKTAAAPGSFPSKTGYTLDILGNPSAHDVPETTSADTATFDKANKLTARSAKGTVRTSGFTDTFNGSVSPSPWTAIGSGDTYTTGTGGLTVTGRTRYNTGTGDQEDRFILLLPQNSGPFSATIGATLPTGATSGEYGWVFGYKSINDYWLIVGDTSNYESVYHVVNGIKSYAATGGSVGGLGISCSNTAIADEFLYYAFPDGFPSGRIGLYSSIAGMVFPNTLIWSNANHRDLAGRWDNYRTDINVSAGPSANAVDTSTGRLRLEGDPRPILLKGPRTSSGMATFAVRALGSNGPATLTFLFGAEGPDRADTVTLNFGDDSATTTSVCDKDGNPMSLSDLDGDPVLTANPGIDDTMWVRIVWFSGNNVYISRMVKNTGAPTEGEWSSSSDIIEFQCPSDIGAGQIGFGLQYYGEGFADLFELTGLDGLSIDDLTVSSYNGTFQTELVEPFTVDSGGYANDTLTSDSNGNQTYDGTQMCTYDAWNRLKAVKHAYRDSGGTLHSGQVSSTMSYDARGRRISKVVNNTGAWDCTYHYYLDRDSVVEERNGSNQTIKQFVRGKRYIDELVQTSINSDPTNSSHQTCDVNYWALQDANWNVIGIVDGDGVLKERYEYTPYGQRTTFISPGTNDPYCMTAMTASQRAVISGSVTEPYGLCEVGHQGLMHDEETGLIHANARYLNPSLGRWMQREPLGYIDGLSLYQYVRSRPTRYVDPTGWQAEEGDADGGEDYLEEELEKEQEAELVGENAADALTRLQRIEQENRALRGLPPDNSPGMWPADQKTIEDDIKDALKEQEQLTKKCEDEENHHLLPRQFAKNFKKAGLDPEKFTTPVPIGRHRLLPDGIHTGALADSWNGQWKQFFSDYPNADAAQILAQLAKMRQKFGI